MNKESSLQYSFTYRFNQGVTFSPFFATPSRFLPHTRTASVVHSESSENKDDTLSTKV